MGIIQIIVAARAAARYIAASNISPCPIGKIVPENDSKNMLEQLGL